MLRRHHQDASAVGKGSRGSLRAELPPMYLLWCTSVYFLFLLFSGVFSLSIVKQNSFWVFPSRLREGGMWEISCSCFGNDINLLRRRFQNSLQLFATADSRKPLFPLFVKLRLQITQLNHTINPST